MPGTKSSQHKYLNYHSESWTLTPAEWKEKLQLFLAEVTSDVWVHLDDMNTSDRLSIDLKITILPPQKP